MTIAYDLALDENADRQVQKLAKARGVSADEILSSIVDKFLTQTNNVERRSHPNVLPIRSKKGPEK